MRSFWGGRPARGGKSARDDAPRERDRSTRSDRAEILRLIEKLRENRRRLETSGGPSHAKAKAAIDAALNAQRTRLGDRDEPARARTAQLPPGDAAQPDTLGLGPGPSAAPRGGGASGVLQRVEERLARIEARLNEAGGAQSSSGAAGGDYTLAGIIQGDMLSDILQMLSSNSMSGIFRVESEFAQHTIHVSEGQIVHAEGAGMKGEGSFFAAFATTKGRYSFRQTTELSQEKTIEGNTQFLILEALRRIDEGGSEPDEGEK